MAAIQSQLEISRGLWPGRQPSSSRNTTSKTGAEKSVHLVVCHRSPSYRGGKTDKADAQTHTHTNTHADRQEARQTHTKTQVDRQRDKLTGGQNSF